MPITASYTVSTEAQLNAAIAAINSGGSSSAPDTAYSITLSDDIVLNSDITAINLAVGDSLTITGNSANNSSAVIDGNNAHRGFVVDSGSVTLDSLLLQNLVAKGSAGGNGATPGGGAAGLGGAVFVGSGANVDLSNTSFTGNLAAGGKGGTKSGTGTGAGGSSGLPGGFGSGGAGGVAAGFGGGGGSGAAGGFGGGNNAGGGLAAGGNIFVEAGGSLSVSSGSVGAGGLSAGAAGSGGTNGGAYGSGIFIAGNTSITLGTLTVKGVIADQTGSGGTGANAGAGSVLIDGNTVLAAHNTYTGGTQIEAGSLSLQIAGAAGSGAINFAGAGTSLIIGAGDVPANAITGFSLGDTIDLQGIGVATGAKVAAGNQLVVQDSTGTVTLQLDPAANYAADSFLATSDGATGTILQITQSHFTVASESDLNLALAEIDAGGKYQLPNIAYTITLAAGFTLNGDIGAINLATGDSLTIDGAGNTIDGGGVYRGFLAYAGSITIENLTIADTVATGGAGGAGAEAGGGGAGLGGGLFVAAGAAVTLSSVSFASDAAVGGAGGLVSGFGFGGGGGLGGAGGNGATGEAGGGGVGLGATGGSKGVNAGAGDLYGIAGGNAGTGQGGGGGGGDGGGGGVAGQFSGSGRDPRSFPGSAGAGGASGNGNFGGGAGEGQLAGLGGGGAGFNGAGGANTGNAASGTGGFGGGGAGGANGGFGGGNSSGAGGGGGLGAGGSVFVQQGGSLTITGGGISGGTATGGTGSNGSTNGASYGSGIFLQGNQSITLSGQSATPLVVSDVIADQAGSAAGASGAGSLVIGAYTVDLTAANSFTGGVTLDNRTTLELGSLLAAGSGKIIFAYAGSATLVVGSGDVPANIISGFLPGDVIDLQGIGTATSALLGSGDVLAVSGGSTSVALNLDPSQIFTGESFVTNPDGHGGTLVTAVTTGNDYPPEITGMGLGLSGNDHTSFAPLAGVTIIDPDLGQTETATLTLSSTADGTLSNLGIGNYNPATGVYTVSGSAAAVTAALDGLLFTPTEYQVAPGQSVQTKFSLAVTDGTMAAAASDRVSITALEDPPVITGAGIWVNNAYFTVPVDPFPGVTVTEPDFGATVTATLALGNSGGGIGYGTLALPASFTGVTLTNTGSGTYTLSAASAALMTQAIDALTFTPEPNPSAPGFTITYVGLSVSDGTSTTSAYNTVSAGAPVILGTVAGQTLLDTSTIQPLSTVALSDSPGVTSLSATITLTTPSGTATAAQGTLSGPGLTSLGGGIYTLAATTPAQLTAEVDALVFTPTAHEVAAGKTVTTDFLLSVFDGATTSDNGTASVVVTATPASSSWVGPSTGGPGGDWNTATNWSPGDIPAAKTKVTIAAAGTYTVAINQSNTVGALVITNAGATLAVNSGTFLVNHATTNGGMLEALGGRVDLAGAVTGTGFETIAGGVLEFGGSVAATQSVAFTGAGGTLQLDVAQNFAGVISNFVAGDVVDLKNFRFSHKPAITGVAGTGAAGTDTIVTVTDGALVAHLALYNQTAGQYAINTGAYGLAQDSGTGTLFQL